MSVRDQLTCPQFRNSVSQVSMNFFVVSVGDVASSLKEWGVRKARVDFNA